MLVVGLVVGVAVVVCVDSARITFATIPIAAKKINIFFVKLNTPFLYRIKKYQP